MKIIEFFVLNLVGLHENKRIQSLYGCLRFFISVTTETLLKHYLALYLFQIQFPSSLN